MKDCIRFNICSAPLCPLDKELHKRVWAWNEPICKNTKVNKKLFVYRQRQANKIKRNEGRVFSFDELNKPKKKLTDLQKIGLDNARKQRYHGE